MGAWDFGPFDNDDAADWLYELEESTDTSAIAAAFEAITDNGEEYLEASDCSSALAAAEIVAALCGHPAADLPDNAKNWVEAHRGLDTIVLVPAARAVLHSIRTKSELKDLWDEAEEPAKWYATLDVLSSRLNEPGRK